MELRAMVMLNVKSKIKATPLLLKTRCMVLRAASLASLSLLISHASAEEPSSSLMLEGRLDLSFAFSRYGIASAKKGPRPIKLTPMMIGSHRETRIRAEVRRVAVAWHRRPMASRRKKA